MRRGQGPGSGTAFRALGRGFITGAARRAGGGQRGHLTLGRPCWQRAVLPAALIKTGLWLHPWLHSCVSSAHPHVSAVCYSTNWPGPPGDGKNTPVC